MVNGDIVDYEKITGDHNKFFNDILEPLFYSALATPRENDYYEIFDYKCKIPFLNGGLFEPLNYYNWQETDILLDNQIFKDIIKTFDEFNFTVKEDEPLDKEVAVDPEMLGKVFENLLTVTDRKSKGAFYTPREIVHYMCQQSLINYLGTNTDVPVGDIETFIQHGELAQQITSRTDVNDKYLPASIKNNYNKIDTLLKNIKIVDPAVGSGAFPMGMMNEIVKARYILSWLSEEEKLNYYDLKRETIENCLYGVDIDSSAVDITKLRFWLSLVVDETDIKKIKPLPNLDHRIMCGNSLLEEFEGVKLFDERLLEEIPEISEFELEQVNSEIEKLYKELGEIHTGKRKDNGRKNEIEKDLKKLERKRKAISSGPKEDKRQSTFDSVFENRIKESQKKLAELKQLQNDFFNEENRERKKKLAENIDKIEWELIEETLKEQGNEAAMQKLQQYRKDKSKPFFLWKLYFSEVFQRENPGFDVVIANPPYLGEKGYKEIFRELKISEFGKRFYKRKMDIFYFFFHKSLDLAKRKATISFISTNYFITADGALYLRTDFKKRAIIKKLINFNELRIFDSAKGQHNMITILEKNYQPNFNAETCITGRTGNASTNIISSILSWNDKESEYFSVKQDDLYDGENNYIRFRGNESNDARQYYEVLLKKIKQGSSPLIQIKNVNQGLITGADKVTDRHITDLKLEQIQKGEGVYVLSDSEVAILDLNESEKNIIKPFYKNSDIYRYFTNSVKDKKNLIYVTRDLNIDDYPNIKKHLLKYEKIIKSRSEERGEMQAALKLGKWWVIFAARNNMIFERAKIVCPHRSYRNNFGYNEEPWYTSADVYFISNKENDNGNIDLKYILALLNSKLFYIWLYFRGKRKGELLELYYKPLTEIPIKIIETEQQVPFIKIINQILSLTSVPDYLDSPEKQARVKTLEKQIDQLVYKLYDLTPEEIAIVENFNKGKKQ